MQYETEPNPDTQQQLRPQDPFSAHREQGCNQWRNPAGDYVTHRIEKQYGTVIICGISFKRAKNANTFKCNHLRLTTT